MEKIVKKLLKNLIKKIKIKIKIKNFSSTVLQFPQNCLVPNFGNYEINIP